MEVERVVAFGEDTDVDMFRASVVPVSKELTKNADSIFYSFIWNGKDQVKRNVLTATMNGSLNMHDIDSMIRTKRIFCLKKYLEDYPPSLWKFFLDERLLLICWWKLCTSDCNLNIAKLPLTFHLSAVH